jgi:hypothetical protein
VKNLIVLVSLLLTFILAVRADASNVQLPATGQKVSYATGDDGALQRGVVWPAQRFTDVGNGMVSDNLTGLVWTKDANLVQSRDPGYAGNPSGYVTWQQALAYVAKLNAENYLGHSDWRLPNRKEMRSLVDYSRNGPALPAGTPFTNVQVYWYWSSSTDADLPSSGWIVDMLDGGVFELSKSLASGFVWPVRGGLPGGMALLTVTPTGTGSGTIVSNPGGLVCNVSCSGQFPWGTSVTLQASPATYSLFTNWGAPCSGNGDCTLSMLGETTVNAVFTLNTAYMVRLNRSTPPYFSSLTSAYNSAAPAGDTIQAWALPFAENLNMNLNKSLTIQGGYDAGYDAITGYTTLSGVLTVGSGAVTVQNLIVQ